MKKRQDGTAWIRQGGKRKEKQHNKIATQTFHVVFFTQFSMSCQRLVSWLLDRMLIVWTCTQPGLIEHRVSCYLHQRHIHLQQRLTHPVYLCSFVQYVCSGIYLEDFPVYDSRTYFMCEINLHKMTCKIHPLKIVTANRWQQEAQAGLTSYKHQTETRNFISSLLPPTSNTRRHFKLAHFISFYTSCRSLVIPSSLSAVTNYYHILFSVACRVNTVEHTSIHNSTLN